MIIFTKNTYIHSFKKSNGHSSDPPEHQVISYTIVLNDSFQGWLRSRLVQTSSMFNVLLRQVTISWNFQKTHFVQTLSILINWISDILRPCPVFLNNTGVEKSLPCWLRSIVSILFNPPEPRSQIASSILQGHPPCPLSEPPASV